jgi:hypothetical protein
MHVLILKGPALPMGRNFGRNKTKSGRKNLGRKGAELFAQ